MKMFAFAIAMFAATAVSGQTPAASSGTQASSSSANPNETVCRRIHESGSRLNSSRICMTRQQWIDWQRQQRADTEQSQNRRVAPRP